MTSPEVLATSTDVPGDPARSLNIWIVHTGEPLPGHGVDMHAAPLARELARRGHGVLWWNTAFDHFSKRWIFDADTEIAADGFRIVAVKGLGYPTNTSLRRLLDHRWIAHRWTRLAEVRRPPDVVLVASPPHDLAVSAVRYARAHGIPVILDLRDPWPASLLDLLPESLRPAGSLVLQSDYRVFKRAVRDCTALTAVTFTLLEWGGAFAGRGLREDDQVFYTGAPRPTDQSPSQSLSNLLARLAGAFVVVFVGSFGVYHSPFIALEAAERLGEANVHFVLAGNGDQAEVLERKAQHLSNVHFTGWLSAADSASLMRGGHVGICPTTQTQPVLPNKAAAYLREGLPVVSSFPGDLARLIDEYEVGINYAPGDVDAFVGAIEMLRLRPDLRERMSANALQLYSEKFDADRNRARLADHVEQITLGWRG